MDRVITLTHSQSVILLALVSGDATRERDRDELESIIRA